MTINTGNNQLDDLLTKHLIKLAARNVPQGNLLSTVAGIPEAAFHDFSSYRFLLTPHYTRMLSTSPGQSGGLTVDGSDVPLGTYYEFDRFVSQFKPDISRVIADWFKNEGSKMDLKGGWTYQWPYEAPDLGGAWIDLEARTGFRNGMAPELFELYMATAQPDPFLLAAYKAVSEWLSSALNALLGQNNRYSYDAILRTGDASFWTKGVAEVSSKLKTFLPDLNAEADEGSEFGEELPGSYTFEPFMTNSINFGLQIIYRQSWIPLGTQPGEIVRTLPLGPKQTEKISFKVVRRSKATRQAEIATSIETATESSAATKDSSEVMQEASEKFNWHVEASASASWGFGSASLKAGAGGENASASKDTKSQLNETMEKTASKIRKDTKIIVSTEVEETSELSQMSEITNPNDEIAVTYIFSRLQRQYELRTYLSEVNQVIFVAEQIPAPDEITGPWIRRYDWVIAKELLDESFRSDLDVVRNHERDNQQADDIDDRIRSLMESISGTGAGNGTAPGIPDYGTLPGKIPDLFQNQQAAYERELERKRAKDADQEQYRRCVRRLRAHIYDNILHYCRAIWSSEDPDTRILRYQQIRIPIKWESVATGSGPHSVYGYFVPAVTDFEQHTAPLSDLVNPAGPIGFAGNYAIFYLRQSTRWSTLLQMLSIIQAPYLAFDVYIEGDSLNQAIDLRATVSDNITGPAHYRCTYDAGGNGVPKLSIKELRDGKTWLVVRDIPIKDDSSIVFLGIRLWISGMAAFADGDVFDIVVTTQQYLEDPELKALRWTLPSLVEKDKATFYSPTVISEMREYFTDVFLAFANSAHDITWAKSSAEQRKILEDRYYDYLLRKRHTRRIMLDTNNLLLRREVDSDTTLEPFKGLHRVIDVLKANEEFNEIVLENERKRARLKADKLGDPDVEKVTVVASVPGAANLAALDGLEEDPNGDNPPVGSP